MSSHGHQFGKQVWTSNTGICGVNWKSFDQWSTWKSKRNGLYCLYLHQNVLQSIKLWEFKKVEDLF